MVLHADELRPAVRFGEVERLAELPRPHRRRAEVPHLARLHDVVQRLEHLLHRRAPVEPVDLVQVDEVGAQPAQAVVDLGQDRLAGQPDAVRPLAHRTVHLRRDDDLVAVHAEILQRPAEELLAGPPGVDVGGVEEVDAGVERLLEERARRLLVERPGVAATRPLAVAHAPQADAGDVETGPSELHNVHLRANTTQ